MRVVMRMRGPIGSTATVPAVIWSASAVRMPKARGGHDRRFGDRRRRIALDDEHCGGVVQAGEARAEIARPVRKGEQEEGIRPQQEAGAERRESEQRADQAICSTGADTPFQCGTSGSPVFGMVRASSACIAAMRSARPRS